MKIYVVMRQNYGEYENKETEGFCLFLTKEFAQAFSLIATIFDYMHLYIFETEKKLRNYKDFKEKKKTWTIWDDDDTWRYYACEYIPREFKKEM